MNKLIFICLSCFIIYASLEIGLADENFWSIIIITIFSLYCIKNADQFNFKQLTLILIFIFLYLLPSIGIMIVYNQSVLLPLLFFCIFYILFNYDKTERLTYDHYNKNLSILSFICFIFLVLSSLSAIFSTLASSIFYVTSLFFFEKMLRNRLSKNLAFMFLIFYIFSVLLYVTFFWGGYGRLVIIADLLIPLLLIHHYKYFKVNIRYLFLLSPIMLYVAQLTRYEDVVSIETFLIGSAGHHLILTDDIYKMKVIDRIIHLDFNFIDQYVLLFLNWFPRALWESKPLSIGYISVMSMVGPNLLGLNYSQSVGFVGENILYFGEFFFIGLIIAFLTLFIFSKILNYVSSDYSILQIVFYVNLFSYFWGGMAQMGSRLWFMLFPLIFLLLVDRIFNVKRNITK